MDPCLRWRREFPILRHTNYLISNSLGAMPRGVRRSLREYADTWARRGVRAWEEGWWEMAANVGDLIAPLIGARSGELSLHQNVTLTQAVVASCFDWRAPRNRIVLVEEEFPSILYFYLEQRRLGARVDVVPLRHLLSAIDRQTALVPVSQVLFRTSELVDAAAIVERAHRCGARVMLDVFQAAGALPVAVRDLGVDFATGGVLKWLCGGPGVGFLYVREDLRSRLRPTLTGWMAHRHPFAFAAGPIQPRADAWRFLNGTPAIPALHACQPGLRIVAAAGIANIRARSRRQTTRLIDGARARGWRVRTPADPDRRGGTVVIDFPGAEAVCRSLVERNILVDYRPNAGIRFSPHFYTRDEEIDAALAATELLAARGGR